MLQAVSVPSNRSNLGDCRHLDSVYVNDMTFLAAESDTKNDEDDTELSKERALAFVLHPYSQLQRCLVSQKEHH